MKKLFVYGTLKFGYYNHYILERNNAEYLGDFRTLPEYTMISLGGFPGILEGGDTSIIGEVYSVNNLHDLDNLEGYPEFYNRKKIKTSYGNAFIYYLHDKEKYINYPVIENGVW